MLPNRATAVETSPMSHTVTNPSFLSPPPPSTTTTTTITRGRHRCRRAPRSMPIGPNWGGLIDSPHPCHAPTTTTAITAPSTRPHRHRRRHDMPRHRRQHDMPCHRRRNGCHVTAVNADATRYRQRGGYWGEGQTCREEGRKGAGREMKTQDQGDDDDIAVVPASSQRRRGGGGSNGASSFRPSSCSYLQCQKWGGVKPTTALF